MKKNQEKTSITFVKGADGYNLLEFLKNLLGMWIGENVLVVFSQSVLPKVMQQ